MRLNRRSVKNHLLPAVAAALCVMACAIWSSAYAAPAGFNQAVQTFNNRQYSQALAQFDAISRANPSDASSHYYMGLCYHYLNQVGSAVQQYQWVASYSHDSRLRAQALNALQQLGRYQATRTSQGQAGIPSKVQSISTSRPSGTGRPKVLEFYTDWCGPCKIFRPQFEQLQSDFGSRVAFESLNAEDGGTGSDLAQKYEVNAYPTVIYLDGSGQVVDRQSGASYASVASRLKKLFANL